MESRDAMNAIVVKYFSYKEYERHPKFSYQIAFARLNKVLDTLLNTHGIDSISVIVPDNEYDVACRYVNHASNLMFKHSDQNEIAAFKSRSPVLCIDEQAFYVYEQLIERFVTLASEHKIISWIDDELLLSSFNYISSFYFFIAPGHIVKEGVKKHSSFNALFCQITEDRSGFKYIIGSKDITGAYAKCMEVNRLPYHFAIEPTSYCDSKCIMCPFHSPDPEIAKGSVYLGDGGENMPLEKFIELVDEIDQLPWNYLPVYRNPQITIQLRGEPLLAPNFKEMCQYVKSKGIRLSFSTNGNTLHKNDMIDFLLEIGLDEIIVSIDSDEERFNTIRPQLSYENVTNNLELLYSKRLEKKLDYPIIYTKTVKLKDSQPINFEEVANKHTQYSDMTGFAFENYVDKNTDVKGYYEYFFMVPQEKRLPCLLVTDVVDVYADGEVKLCHAWVKSSLGNVFEENLTKILVNSELRNEVLVNHAEGNYGLKSFCDPCTSWLAQYNTVFETEDYKIYQNPMLSYWQKRIPQLPQIDRSSLFVRIINRLWELARSAVRLRAARGN